MHLNNAFAYAEHMHGLMQCSACALHVQMHVHMHALHVAATLCAAQCAALVHFCANMHLHILF